MTQYFEPGFSINLPEGSHFRFQDCPVYQKLKNLSIKEMDFFWFDTQTKLLCLMEVKDYTHLSKEEALPEYLIENLYKKGLDSILMLAAVWANTKTGRALKDFIPNTLHNYQENIMLIFILNANDRHLPAIGIIKDRLKQKTKGIRALFSVTAILMDKKTAQARGLPIS